VKLQALKRESFAPYSELQCNIAATNSKYLSRLGKEGFWDDSHWTIAVQDNCHENNYHLARATATSGL